MLYKFLEIYQCPHCPWYVLFIRALVLLCLIIDYNSMVYQSSFQFFLKILTWSHLYFCSLNLASSRPVNVNLESMSLIWVLLTHRYLGHIPDLLNLFTWYSYYMLGLFMVYYISGLLCHLKIFSSKDCVHLFLEIRWMFTVKISLNDYIYRYFVHNFLNWLSSCILVINSYISLLTIISNVTYSHLYHLQIVLFFCFYSDASLQTLAIHYRAECFIFNKEGLSQSPVEKDYARHFEVQVFDAII